MAITAGVISLAACTVANNPAAQNPQDSGIEGKVLIGPVEPISPAGSAPSTQPYAATLSIRLAKDDREVAKVQSGADGMFRVALAPGDYRIVPLSPNPGAPPYAEPLNVQVSTGKFLSVTVNYDSGIR